MKAKVYPIKEGICNQYMIDTPEGRYFQSYRAIIAFIPISAGRKVQLDKHYWDYSRTTGKYRNEFLGETKRETEAKIKTGEYELTDLN